MTEFKFIAPLRVVESLVDYARMLARIRRASDELAMLKAAGVSNAEWSRAQSWPQRLAAAALEGDLEMSDIFTKAFVAEMESSAEGVLPATLGHAVPHEGERDQRPGPSALEAVNVAARSTERRPDDIPAVGGEEAIAISEPDPLGSTVSVEIDRLAMAALPFVSPPIPIDRYAAISASLEAFPEKRAAILERFGIGSDRHLNSIAQEFEVHFSRSPWSRTEFRMRLDEARDRIRTRS